MTTSELTRHGSGDPEGAAPSTGRGRLGGLGYLVPFWSVVVVFGAVMLTWSAHVGIPPRDPRGSIFVSRIAISLGLLVPLSAIEAAWRVARRDGRAGLSRAATARAWRERWTGRRLLLTVLALLGYHLVYFSYHNLKSWDVLRAPEDAMLLRWDRWLFLGHSPAVLLHDLLGQGVAHYVLMVVYESFSTIVMIATVAALVFAPRLRDGYAAIASGLWIWVLGVGSYYLIPTLGPFHSAPQEFAGLPHTMIQDTQARYLAQRAHLLADPAAHDAFAQISAFASLHVGVTTVVLLMARWYGLRRLSRAMAVYLAGVVVATVYLGWHFFVDDVAGLAIGWLSVFLGTRMIYFPTGRRPGRPDRSGRSGPAVTEAPEGARP
ncbi:phosphatase PAP2 family protein [Nocardioides korecus]